MNLFPMIFWAVVIASAIMSAMGFYRFIWFLSVGYGLSIAASGLVMGIYAIATHTVSVAFEIQCVLFVIYGCRLGLFLLIRETKNSAYRKTLDSQTEKKVPLFVEIMMWIILAFLYPAMVSPTVYRYSNGAVTFLGDSVMWIGMAVMLLGIIIEATADKQKSAAKAKDASMPAMDGLYKMCRCPNYFGEVLFWTGVLISGLNILSGWQWAMALVGYVSIVYIMFDGAKRLEIRHNKNYGDSEVYRKYADTTPILIPLLPIYHLVKEK